VLDGADSPLKGGSVPHVCDVTCTLSVGVQGNKASLYLMDQLLASVTVTGPESVGAGFRVNALNHNWKLDDFQVCAYGYGAQPGYTLFRDTFSTLFVPQNRDNDYATVKESMAGTYQQELTAKQGFVSRSAASPALATNDNFFFGLTTHVESVSPTASSGVIFHFVDSKNYYAAFIDNQGDYTVEALVNDEWQTITDWTKSDLIVPGQANRVAILAEGTNYTLYINNQSAGQFSDDLLKAGTFGFISSLDNADDEATVDFSNLEVYGPQKKFFWVLFWLASEPK
jgi:hypothetical protein